MTAVTPSAPVPAIDPSKYATYLDALAAFHSVLPTIRKGNEAKVDSARGSYTYSYADLADVSDAVLPLLGAHGLVWECDPDTTENGTIILRWSLTHAATGDGRSGSVPVGRQGDKWQDLGGALTYARRYMLVSVTGVAPGGDDNDGRGASVGAGRQSAPADRQYLPEGLYDLDKIDSAATAEQTFYAARGNGHLGLFVKTLDGTEMPFAEWLRAQASKYPAVAPEDEPKVESEDAEAAEAAAVAAHEAELAKRETAEANDDKDQARSIENGEGA